MINKETIFSIKNEEEFNKIALDIFKFQYDNTLIYRNYIDLLEVKVEYIKSYTDIPFLPIELYKTNTILDKNHTPDYYFQSSGTTSEDVSKHYIADFTIYDESLLKSFELFLGDPSQYVFLGLLPNYLERNNSSLIYMVNKLMEKSVKPENGYFLKEFYELDKLLKELEAKGQKVILFGVSYALLDFAEQYPQQFENTIVIETGGMKGRKEEMTKDDLLKELKASFNTERIYSEYSMTELLSQAYSLENNKYQCPPWMKIIIRDIENPLSIIPRAERVGAINIIDLANIHTCSFIATQDMGQLNVDNSFQVLGRLNNADLRGCSLLLLEK